MNFDYSSGSVYCAHGFTFRPVPMGLKSSIAAELPIARGRQVATTSEAADNTITIDLPRGPYVAIKAQEHP